MFTSRPNAPIVGASKRMGSADCRCAIETQFPRLARELAQNWFRDGIDDLLDHLILDDRSSRAGFPFEVIEELLFLADIRWHLTYQQPAREAAYTADMEFLDYAPPNQEHGLAWMPRVDKSVTAAVVPGQPRIKLFS